MTTKETWLAVAHAGTAAIGARLGPDGDWEPAAFMFQGDAPEALIAISFEDDKEKEQVIRRLGIYAIEHKITGVGLVLSSWMATLKEGEELEGPVSEHSDREEVLLLHWLSATESYTEMAPINRAPGESPSLGEWEALPAGEDSWSRFEVLRRALVPTSEEDIAKMAAEVLAEAEHYRGGE